MNEHELIGLFLRTPVLIMAVIAQGFVIGLALLVIVYKLSHKFLQNQDRQAQAFEQIALSMQSLKDHAVRDDNFAVECRIAIQAIDSKIERLSDKISYILEPIAQSQNTTLG